MSKSTRGRPPLSRTAPFQFPPGAFEHIASGGVLGDALNFKGVDYEVLYSVGHTLYQQGRFEDAGKIFSFLVIHNHWERKYLHAYAAALHMAGEYAAAIPCYLLAAAMDADDATPALQVCECTLALGHTTEARQALECLVRDFTGEQHAHVRERASAMLQLIPLPANNAEGKTA